MFTTPINIPSSLHQIDYQSRIVMLGSCFTENIGLKLQSSCFDVDINPFGVLYNPISIANSIRRLLENKTFADSDLFEYKSLWRSFMHDSSFSDASQEKTLSIINKRFEKVVSSLKNLDFLFLTFGTAWIFEEKETNLVVSNCHKMPANQFDRRRLSVGEIVEQYGQLIKNLQNINPNLNIVFSVSPIRHWKDGAHENNLSKGTLLLAVDALQKQFEKIDYFPAYEIVMDELRDYRFYASDMLHPSQVAIDYIWKRFGDTYFSDDTQQLMKRINQYNADLTHRPLHPDSEEYQVFINNIKKKKTDIVADFPFLADRMRSKDVSH